MIAPHVKRHAVVLASVVGLAKASAQTGFAQSTICEWRRAIETQTGERFPRLPRANNLPPPKLSPEKAREIRRRRAGGKSWGWLAVRYGVSPTAVVKVCNREIYRHAE